MHTAREIYQAFTDYKATLSPWLKGESGDALQVLMVLRSRDHLHTVLQQHPTPNAHILQEIQTLDSQLQKQAPQVAALLDLKEYRKSFPKTSEQWWWSLDEQTTHRSNRYDWVFKGLTVGTWALILGLLGNISGKFLLGGAGVAGLSAVALSSLITLVKARNDLTDASRQGFEALLAKLLPDHWHEEAKFGSTALLASTLVAFWLALPLLSSRYDQRGQIAQDAGDLGTAEQNYNLAISLNPDNADAHYNLATLYEDIQLLDKAKTEYLIAMRGNFPEAYNNLARLYLQPPQPDPNKAAILLNQGIRLADEQQSFPEVKYSLYKNLGWARFQQAQYPEAKSALETAIRISNQPNAEHITNPGSAHCLLAQTLDEQKLPGAIQAWQQCCQLGDSGHPDESAWLLKARTRLETEGFNFNELCKPTATPIP